MSRFKVWITYAEPGVVVTCAAPFYDSDPASFHGSSWPPPVSGGPARPHGKGGPGSHVLGSCSSQR